MVRLALPRAQMAASCFPEGMGDGNCARQAWCLRLHQCHGKSEALIFVPDCSSLIFTTGNFRLLCSHQLGREVLRGDGRRWLSQQPSSQAQNLALLRISPTISLTDTHIVYL